MTSYVYLVCLLNASWLLYGAGQSCTFEYKNDTTVDRKSSIAAGASIHLLANNGPTDVQSCAKACCDDEHCDVALFDEQHARCFLMNCNPLEKCVYAHHHNVTSIVTRHNVNALESLMTTTSHDSHGADIPSADDQQHLENVLGATTDSVHSTVNKSTTSASSATATTAAGTTAFGTTPSSTSSQSVNVATETTSDVSDTPKDYVKVDDMTLTVMKLALKNNLTTTANPENMTRQELNDILAKLIVKSGLTQLTKNGVAFTLAQISYSDLKELVDALDGSKATTTTALPPVDENVAELIADLGFMLNLTESKAKLNSREEVNLLLAKVIAASGLTNLTKDGVALTISKLTADDLATLADTVERKVKMKEVGLSRNRGDLDDKNAQTSVNVVQGGDQQNGTVHQISPSKTADDTARNATLISVLTVGCVFTVLVFVLIGKRFYDSYERRHYNKIDHLINGIYQ